MVNSIFIRFFLLSVVIGVFCSASWFHHTLLDAVDENQSTSVDRFTKISPQGAPMSKNEGPWHCVYDQKTQLTWMVGRDDESPFDSYWTYSWYDGAPGRGESGAGSCFFNNKGCDTSDLLKKANERNLCRLNSWRLPSQEELLTLVQGPAKISGATVQSAYFPNTKKGDYWTSDHSKKIESDALRHLKEGANAVSFKTGKVRVLPYRTAAYVRLVSDAKNIRK